MDLFIAPVPPPGRGLFGKPSGAARQRRPVRARPAVGQAKERSIRLLRRLMRMLGVPLPGGHGARLPELRRLRPDPDRPMCAAFLRTPDPRASAVLCLSMLAMGGQGAGRHDAERWFATNFLVHANDWVAQRIVDLRRNSCRRAAAALQSIPKRQRWRYLLRAITDLAASSPGIDGAQFDSLRDGSLFGTAMARLNGLCTQWRGSIPPPLGPVPGRKLPEPDKGWALVSEMLADMRGTTALDSSLVCAMYWMHLFHAYAGLWQVPLTDGSAWHNPRWKRRTAFYRSVLRLLRHSCRCAPMRQTAERVVAGLERLPLFCRNPDAAATARAEQLTLLLPECFGPYLGYRVPHVVVSASSVTHPDAERAIRRLHHLAEMMVEQLLDPQRVRPLRDHAPGFCADDYIYADSRARYGQWTGVRADLDVRHEAQCPPDDDAAIEEALRARNEAFRQDRAAYFANLRLARIRTVVGRCLPDFVRTPWVDDDTTPARCAMCHIEMRANGEPK